MGVNAHIQHSPTYYLHQTQTCNTCGSPDHLYRSCTIEPGKGSNVTEINPDPEEEIEENNLMTAGTNTPTTQSLRDDTGQGLLPEAPTQPQESIETILDQTEQTQPQIEPNDNEIT